jgi:hypothetical protein
MRRRRVVVIGSGIGQLANRLLLFAHVSAAAAEHGFLVVNPQFGRYARYFPTTARDLLPRFPPGRPLPGGGMPGARRVTRRAALTLGTALHLL